MNYYNGSAVHAAAALAVWWHTLGEMNKEAHSACLHI